MENTSKTNICFCGHDCSRCNTYLATIQNNDELRLKVQKFYYEEFGQFIQLSQIHCKGGRSGDVFFMCNGCPWVKCCSAHKIDSCSDCEKYPCVPLKEYIEKYVNKCNQTNTNL